MTCGKFHYYISNKEKYREETRKKKFFGGFAFHIITSGGKFSHLLILIKLYYKPTDLSCNPITGTEGRGAWDDNLPNPLKPNIPVFDELPSVKSLTELLGVE